MFVGVVGGRGRGGQEEVCVGVVNAGSTYIVARGMGNRGMHLRKRRGKERVSESEMKANNIVQLYVVHGDVLYSVLIWLKHLSQ